MPIRTHATPWRFCQHAFRLMHVTMLEPIQMQYKRMQRFKHALMDLCSLNEFTNVRLNAMQQK
jgi:hypothetical protein